LYHDEIKVDRKNHDFVNQDQKLLKQKENVKMQL